MAERLKPVGNGRSEGGRFGAGNSFAKGNPLNQRVQKLRCALLRSLTSKDVRDVAAALLKKARKGDVQAAKELFDRALGKPRQSIELEGEGVSAASIAAVILQALEEFPVARQAVAAKLRGLTSGHG